MYFRVQCARFFGQHKALEPRVVRCLLAVKQPVLFHELQDAGRGRAAHGKLCFDIALKPVPLPLALDQIVQYHALHVHDAIDIRAGHHAGHLPFEQIVGHAQFRTDSFFHNLLASLLLVY